MLKAFGYKKEQTEECYVLLPLNEKVNEMETGAVANGIRGDTYSLEKAMKLADSLQVTVIIQAFTSIATVRIPYYNLTLKLFTTV